MPTIQVPFKPWSATPLKKNRKFKVLGDEAVDLASQLKFINARLGELRLEMADIMNETLDDQTKTVLYPVVCTNEDCPRYDPDEPHTHDVKLTRSAGGSTSKFDKKVLMTVPIPCSNPKCKTDNHVTPDIIELCTTRGTSRPSVKITLPGDKDENE